MIKEGYTDSERQKLAILGFTAIDNCIDTLNELIDCENDLDRAEDLRRITFQLYDFYYYYRNSVELLK